MSMSVPLCVCCFSSCLASADAVRVLVGWEVAGRQLAPSLHTGQARVLVTHYQRSNMAPTRLVAMLLPRRMGQAFHSRGSRCLRMRLCACACASGVRLLRVQFGTRAQVRLIAYG